ncbi:MAG: LysM domain [Myxococcales bacterium]|nr:LysM domain [Myxococcales bacterium]
MAKLERARIHVLKGDGQKSSDVDTHIEVCFNPKEYSLEKSVEWDAEKAFSDAPQPEFKAPKPMTLSVTLQFDSYEERVSVRDKWVRKIEKLTMMAQQLKNDGKGANKADKQKYRPPVILFIWGRFTFKGVIESLSQKYTMFLSDGTPVRAECGLKIRNVIDNNIDEGTSQNWSASKGGSGKPYTVQQNDRLDLIAATQLGDAGRWPEIAALNDIVDPTTMDNKSTLMIPED